MMIGIKLVIWDLDNTLWDGCVYYKDKEAVTLKPGARETLKELNKRNIKCAICSKNNYDDVIEILEKFDIKKYFLDMEINWNLKSDSIKKILKRCGIKLTEAIFVDDDAFQRGEVKTSISSLRVMELSDPIDILDIEGIMAKNPTRADLDRVTLLKQQRERESAEKRIDFKTFLKECNMKMIVRFAKEDDLPRVVQLLNRTNELNATQNRYALEEIKEEFRSNKIKIFVVELSDKFGDYGLIAEAITVQADNGISIRDLTVSCRTMGRGIGGALLISLLKYCEKNAVQSIEGYLNKSESNWRIKLLYEKRNFKVIKKEDNKTYYKFVIGEDKIKEYPEHLEVKNDFQHHIDNFGILSFYAG